MKTDTIYCTATIREGATAPRITLNLKLDTDDRFRWYTSDGHDTEISASTLPAAIACGHMAWRDWDFTVPHVLGGGF